MTTAIFGLVGVLVGGVINGWVQVRLARRTEIRTIDEEKRSHEREFRVARRVVGDELSTCAMQLEVILHAGVVPVEGAQGSEGFLPLRAWLEHRAALAAEINDDDWTTVSAVVYSTERLRERLLGWSPGSPIPPQELQLYREHVDVLNDALSILGPSQPAESDNER